jgi:hypothetical protein
MCPHNPADILRRTPSMLSFMSQLIDLDSRHFEIRQPFYRAGHACAQRLKSRFSRVVRGAAAAGTKRRTRAEIAAYTAVQYLGLKSLNSRPGAPCYSV